MFKKVGDAMPITNIYEADEPLICQKCNCPMTVIAFQEDDSVDVICTCENPELE